MLWFSSWLESCTLDLSNPGGPYTITASITIPDDPDISNNVSTSLDIVVLATPKLESNKDPGNVICAGDPISFTITPFSATATYTFKVNDGIVQSLFGVNCITFTLVRRVILLWWYSHHWNDWWNGCITNSATQSRTVNVSSLPTAAYLLLLQMVFFVVEML